MAVPRPSWNVLLSHIYAVSTHTAQYLHLFNSFLLSKAVTGCPLLGFLPSVPRSFERRGFSSIIQGLQRLRKARCSTSGKHFIPYNRASRTLNANYRVQIGLELNTRKIVRAGNVESGRCCRRDLVMSDYKACSLGEKVISFVKSLFFATVHFRLVSE